MKRILFVLAIAFSINAQNKDADVILEKVKDKFVKIEDYQATIEVSVDVNFLKVPKARAQIYFKQPDLVKLDSKGFALLPKEVVNFSPTKLFDGDYTAIFVKEDTLDNSNVNVVKVIPNNDSSGVVLTTLWVDDKGDFIRKIETTTKSRGTLLMHLNYSDQAKWGLPSSIIFSFNVSDVSLPNDFAGENSDESQSRNKNKKEPISGKVTLTYSNYKVNQGLADSFFKEKDHSK